MTPPMYEQALDVGGILLSASGGKSCNVLILTACNWSYTGIVVVCVP